jgi:hypothetical protein
MEVARQTGTTHLKGYDKLTQCVVGARIEETEARRALDRFRSEHRREYPKNFSSKLKRH